MASVYVEVNDNQGEVSSVSGTAPINSTGGANPVISITTADATHAGAVSTTTQTFNGDKTIMGTLTAGDGIDTVQILVKSAPYIFPGTFLATYLSSVNADNSSGSPTGTAFGGAIVSGNMLDLTGGGTKYVSYAATGNADFTETGTIRLRVTPNYTGNPTVGGPAGRQVLFSRFQGGTNFANFMELYQASDGTLNAQWADSTGVTFHTFTGGTWNTVLNQTDEIEFDFDLTTGANRLFINGVQLGSTDTTTTTMTTSTSTFYIGYSGYESSNSNIKVSDVALFNTVQHTSNYTSPISYGLQTSDIQEWRSGANVALAKVNGAGKGFFSGLDSGSHPINNVFDPSLAQDAATKNYVDNSGSLTEILLSNSGTHSHSAVLTVEDVQSLLENEVSSVTVTSTNDLGHTHQVTVTWDGTYFHGTIAVNHGHTFETPNTPNLNTPAAEKDNGNSGSALTIDWSSALNQKTTLTAAPCTFTFSNPVAGRVFILKLIQDGGGSKTVTWPASVKWPGGTAPTLTTTAAAIDLVYLYYDGTNFFGNSFLNFS